MPTVEGSTVNDSFLTPIRLDQFLKLIGATDTGGHAKALIQSGEVRVNGDVETRRGRKLIAGDVVALGTLVLPVRDSRAEDAAGTASV